MSAFVFIALMIAMLPALHLNLLVDSAPIRNFQRNDWDLLREQQHNTALDRLFQSAAAGGNLQLHFEGDSFASFSKIFYRAVYAIYPQRVFIGRSPKPINFPENLQAEDTVPSDEWLKSQNIGHVLTYTASANGQVSTNIRTVH